MSIQEFIEYVKSFYSKTANGLYADEYNWSDSLITAGCIIRSNMKEYYGDTVDREWVRDHLLQTVGDGLNNHA